jgi:hypothetical protein
VVHGADEDVPREPRVKIGLEFPAPASLFEDIEQAGIELLDVGKDFRGQEIRIGFEKNTIRKNIVST